jgi:hypothetical protein
VGGRGLRVVAHDGIDVAASVATEDGVPVLVVLRRGQTYESAVDALRTALPNAHPSEVHAYVREALPDAPLLRAQFQEHSPVVPRPPGLRPRRAAVVAGTITAVAVLVTYTLAISGKGSAAPAPTEPTPTVTVVQGLPGSDEAFEDVMWAAQLRCRRVSAANAVCTDPSGAVVAAESTPNLVTLDWAGDRTTVRVFGSAEEASAWSRQQATVKLIRTGVHPVGRYAVWGTDTVELRGLIARLGQRTPGAG